MLSVFPQELIDLIIDQLADDYVTLKACSVTCRSFSLRTRLHLFEEIILKNASGYKRFVAVARRSPSIAASVRTIRIVKSHGLPNRVDRELPEILSKLPGVKHLAITSWKASDLLVRFRNRLPQSLANIRTLHLGGSVDITACDLCALLSACSRLVALSMDRTEVRDPQSSASDQSCSADTLKIARYTSNMLSPLLGLDFALRRLDLSASVSDESELVKALLLASGARFERLTLSLSPGICQTIRQWGSYLSLARNPGLLSLDLISYSLTSAWHWPPNSTNFYATALSIIEPHHQRLNLVRLTLLRGDIGVPWSLRRLPATAPATSTGWGDIDRELVRIAKDHPQVGVVFAVVCDASEVPLDEHLVSAIAAIWKALPKFTYAVPRFRVVCGESWRVNPDFGGCFVGSVRERRFGCWG